MPSSFLIMYWLLWVLMIFFLLIVQKSHQCRLALQSVLRLEFRLRLALLTLPWWIMERFLCKTCACVKGTAKYESMFRPPRIHYHASSFLWNLSECPVNSKALCCVLFVSITVSTTLTLDKQAIKVCLNEPQGKTKHRMTYWALLYYSCHNWIPHVSS